MNLFDIHIVIIVKCILGKLRLGLARRFIAGVILTLVACNSRTIPPYLNNSITATPLQTRPVEPVSETNTPTPQVIPPRDLVICSGTEPDSLFIYGDTSLTGRNIREAIYDGPFDWVDFKASPVILVKVPSLVDKDVILQPVDINPGELIIDNDGNWADLKEGVSYRPSGCTGRQCAQSYAGNQPVRMDRLVVQFKLIPGLKWSDGTPLTADDSLFSYEVAGGLDQSTRPGIVDFTYAYQALDEVTLEWTGIAGYQAALYPDLFFTPLPRHAWQGIPMAELPTADMARRTPMGWGAYRIDEWTSGDHITLSKNPNYFRAKEGLPHFDHLVFRFVSSQEALDALLVGECDVVDSTVSLENQADQVIALQKAGRLGLLYQGGTAWEQVTFGISSADPHKPALFANKEVRQALAMCIDRQSLVDEFSFGQSGIPDTFVLPTDPMYNPGVKSYAYDPQKATVMLFSNGWIDVDNNPNTPRLAQGVTGVPDGTAFSFTYLVPADPDTQRAAQIVQTSLARCGIAAKIVAQDANELFTPGPEGPVFGRHFEMAEFAWPVMQEPPCTLYRSDEIPGPYPESPQGWGGTNAGGYRNLAYDEACKTAMTSLPDTVEYGDAYRQVQTILAEDLPVIPLYWKVKFFLTRPDFCNLVVNVGSAPNLWNIEEYNYMEGCP